MSSRLVSSLLALSLLAATSDVFAQDPIGDDDELRAVPVLRVAVGPSASFTPEMHAELAVETTAGVSALQGIVGGIALNAEAGFLHESGLSKSGLNAGVLTLGVGYGALGMAVTYQPRLVVGVYRAEPAVGMRNGIALHLFADLASLELGHQFVSVVEYDDLGIERTLRHDARLMLGLNPAALVYLVTEVNDAL
jgi:hypothetical protein